MIATTMFWFRRGRWLGAALMAMVSFGQVLASDLEDSDDFTTLEARAILLDDPELGPLNLGVTVRRQHAVLWGPVASRELALRAEIRLRTMLPLADVHNELLVVRPDPASSPLPWFLPNIAATEPLNYTPAAPVLRPKRDQP